MVPGTLTVTPTAPLVVTVNNASRPYGQPNPTFTSTITGAVNGDTFTVTYSTTATIASPVGTYPITATVSGANFGNYAVTVVPGTLTIANVAQATSTVVITSAPAVSQGTSVTFTATVTSASLPVPAANVNFYNGSTLLGTGTLNASGVATYHYLHASGGSLTITATYQATSQFSSSSGTVLQVVESGSFTVTAVPPNQFIRGAGSTVYAIAIGSVQGFAGPVSLSCSGLPADATCSFRQPNRDPGGRWQRQYDVDRRQHRGGCAARSSRAPHRPRQQARRSRRLPSLPPSRSDWEHSFWVGAPQEEAYSLAALGSASPPAFACCSFCSAPPESSAWLVAPA